MLDSLKSLNSDIIGASASGLCLIHCMATPFVFAAKAYTITSCSDAPIWWQAIDYIFIVISFMAIWFATKNSSVTWIKVTLWISWILLLITILSGSLEIGLFPKSFSYVPALAIIVFHFYNLMRTTVRISD